MTQAQFFKLIEVLGVTFAGFAAILFMASWYIWVQTRTRTKR